MAQTIKKHYETICERLAELNYLMTAATPIHAIVRAIPNKTPQQQHEHGVIEPEHFEGAAAAKKAAELYLDLHLKTGLCTKTARRSVGALLYVPNLHPIARDIPACVRAINQAKNDLKQHLLDTYPERYQRFEALREECPAVMALHIYRQIRCMDFMKVNKINFTWQRKTALVRPKSKQDLIRMIDQEISVASAERAETLTQLLTAVTAIPINTIRLRRPVQPQPAANIWLAESPTIINVITPMPILVVQNTPIQNKPLPHFNPAVPPIQRKADKLITEQLGMVRGIIVEQVLRR